MNNDIKNTALKNNLEKILEKGRDFKKGNIGGKSIEYKEGNSFSSLIYYDDEEGRDKDLESIEKFVGTNGKCETAKRLSKEK